MKVVKGCRSHSRGWIYFTLIFAALSVIFSPKVFAAGETLPTLIESAIKNNGEIKEAEAEIEVARGQLERAKAAMFPRGTFTFLAAPVFEERGNAVAVTRNFNNWGPFLTGTSELIQPIYTFGQIGGYRKAAEHQVSAYSHLADAKKNEVLFTLKDFYYSYLMANEFEKLAKDLVGFLEEAVVTSEKNKGSKNSVKPHDIYRLKTALQDLRQKKVMAETGKKTAEKAVAWASGIPNAVLASKTYEPEKYTKKTLEEYLNLARKTRPEFKALTAGQIARESLADAKQAQSYPSLFVAGTVGAGWSPVRDRQDSFYALDMFNRLQGGIAIGLRLDLEFARHAAEASEERAQALKLKAKESYAVPGIELQVKRAFYDLEQAEEGFKIATERRDLAKKWFVSSAMGWSIGVTPAKDLLEALEGNGLAKMNYIYTLYSYNLALAKLSRDVGFEVTDLKAATAPAPEEKPKDE